MLTHEAIHWFIRTEGYDLFGEERGKVGLNAVLSVRVLDEKDGNIFELQSTDYVRRLFKAPSKEVCNEWVTAIRSSVKMYSTQHARRQSMSGQGTDSAEEQQEVELLLVSLKSSSAKSSRSRNQHGTEIVIARKPEYKRTIAIADVRDGDELILSLSDGGTVSLSSEQLWRKAMEEKEFDIAVSNTTLPCSLRMLVLLDKCCPSNDISGDQNSNSYSQQMSKKNSWRVVALTSEPKHAVNLLISIMVVCVGLNTLQYLSFNTSLLYVIALVLASNNITQAVIRFPGKIQSAKRSYVVLVMSHGYTSPDAPVQNAPEEEIPQRFINGCDGDLKEAQRRWDITRHWREAEVHISYFYRFIYDIHFLY